MIFVDNQNHTDPRRNLALEEWLVRHLQTDEDILLFYINEPSVIIGRHQNTIEEVNQAFVEAQHIHVVRRLSGGGAVYHDHGNLNFSFITNNVSENVLNFRKFTEPVIRSLNAMGVGAELSGRNDILVDGRKISGNAQYIVQRRMVSHGTLLFNSELSVLSHALNPKPDKIISKGIKSVRSRVANILEFMPEAIDTLEFRARLQALLFEGQDRIPRYDLAAEEWQQVEELTASRYSTWEWNYGYSPEFNVQKTKRFAFGEVDARIDVQRGVVRSIRFFGDYFCPGDPCVLEEGLTGVRYERSALAAALDAVTFEEIFSGVDKEEFLDFLV